MATGGTAARDDVPRRKADPPGGRTHKVIVRVDLGALLRGLPIEGEVCEIAGFGPVAVSAVRDMIDTDDPFLTAVVTQGEKLVGVAHLGRRPNALQQTALQWLYPSCANEACSAQARLDYDHRVDWARTHFTVLDLLDRLCAHCHALKTGQNWSLVEGRGKRALVPTGGPPPSEGSGMANRPGPPAVWRWPRWPSRPRGSVPPDVGGRCAAAARTLADGRPAEPPAAAPRQRTRRRDPSPHLPDAAGRTRGPEPAAEDSPPIAPSGPVRPRRRAPPPTARPPNSAATRRRDPAQAAARS